MAKMHRSYVISILICLISIEKIHAEVIEKIGHVKTGNIALPTSQQPRALFCLGQTIVEKGDLIGYFQPLFFKGPCKASTEIFPFLVYGLDKRMSLTVSMPFAPKLRLGCNQSSGIEDMLIQLEYAFYVDAQDTYGVQATAVGILGLPTGSPRKNPITGYGSPYFILGTTVSYLSEKWYFYASPFLSLTTKKDNTKFGNRVLYQAGIGRNLGNPLGGILTPMIETAGFYTQKSKINGVVDPKSSGNVYFAGPMIFFSTPRLILQGGILFPIAQHFNDPILKNNFFASFGVGFKFAGPALEK